MKRRIDIVCEDDCGGRDEEVVIGYDEPLPRCACGAKTVQVYKDRKDTEGYWVMRGRNW